VRHCLVSRLTIDVDTDRAAERLENAAERIKIAMAVFLALLVAIAVWLTFLYYLAARIPGSDTAG
jgi:predicted nucleic acid-binding Zn ribbon protein